MSDWQQACEAITNAGAIVLCAHRHPDGDGIGAQMGLYHSFRKAGKTVYAHNRDGVPHMYRFISDTDQITEGTDFPHAGAVDLIICLDSGNIDRLGLPDVFFHGKTVLNIDHHQNNTRFGHINLVAPEASATGEIVLELINRLGLPLSSEAATAIFTAVLTDTCSFRLANANARVHRIAADLIDAGADPWQISTGVYENHSSAWLELLGLCLKTLEIGDKGQSAWLYVNDEMYQKTHANQEDTEGFIEYGRSLEGVEIAVFIRPEEGQGWKVSFRNKKVADVAMLATGLGGGGHAYASGCILTGTLKEVQSRVKSEVSKLLQELSS
ncbi:MAG: bifunctional oligoribonuclease/PAP phosphatase NrnA [Mariprofundaceae bacterium]